MVQDSKIARLRQTVNIEVRLSGSLQAQKLSDMLLNIVEGTLLKENNQVKLSKMLGKIFSKTEELIRSM